MANLHIHGQRKRVTNAVLLTGASGYIGSHQRDRLLADGRDVVSVRRPSSPPSSKGRSVEVDYGDANSVKRAVDEVQPTLIYHVAGATNGIT
mgnify:CR=1 FL=1